MQFKGAPEFCALRIWIIRRMVRGASD